jgi:Fe-S-cluster containining protein
MGWKILLMPDEVTRICQITGKASHEFTDASPLIAAQTEAYISNALDDPLWALLACLWEHPVGIQGRCPFRETDGCVLPYEDKPFICRVYPLDFNITRGTLYLSKVTACPISRSATSADEVLAHFKDGRRALEKRFDLYRSQFLSLLGQLSATEPRGQELPAGSIY